MGDPAPRVAAAGHTWLGPSGAGLQHACGGARRGRARGRAPGRGASGRGVTHLSGPPRGAAAAADGPRRRRRPGPEAPPLPPPRLPAGPDLRGEVAARQRAAAYPARPPPPGPQSESRRVLGRQAPTILRPSAPGLSFGHVLIGAPFPDLKGAELRDQLLTGTRGGVWRPG